MKRLSSRKASSGTSYKIVRLSQPELETLIQEEIQRTIKKNENRLQGLIETIQQLESEVDYEGTIQKLEARIHTVTKRAEAALSYMTKMEKKSPTNLANMGIKTEGMENILQDKKSIDSMDKDGELFQMMETTKQAVKKMHSDNEAVKATVTDLGKELSPPVVTPCGSPVNEVHVKLVKNEPGVTLGKTSSEEEPKAKRMKVESLSPAGSKIDKDSQEEKLSYPPLPPTPLPSVLNMEAASYNIPQRPEVHVALIRDPPGLSVLWKLEKEDPCAAPMDSYSVYMTTEKVKGSGVFPSWKIIGEVRAIELPMCVLIKKYKPGHKLCVAVVGKDVFHRYGPYSEVVTAAVPS